MVLGNYNVHVTMSKPNRYIALKQWPYQGKWNEMKSDLTWFQVHSTTCGLLGRILSKWIVTDFHQSHSEGNGLSRNDWRGFQIDLD